MNHISYKLPEYTQEEINLVLAKRITKQYLTDDEYTMLVNVANDNYILVTNEERGGIRYDC
mgnify:CR=1 FL=1